MCFIQPYVLIKLSIWTICHFFTQQHQLLTRSVMKHTKYPKYQNSTSGDVEYQKSRKFSSKAKCTRSLQTKISSLCNVTKYFFIAIPNFRRKQARVNSRRYCVMLYITILISFFYHSSNSVAYQILKSHDLFPLVPHPDVWSCAWLYSKPQYGLNRRTQERLLPQLLNSPSSGALGLS